MKILVTGPEHSGTGLLKDIVTQLVGQEHEVIHKAMPHVDEHGCELWWLAKHFDFDRVLVIRKLNEDAYRESARKRYKKSPIKRLKKADLYLFELPRVDMFIWYETLVREPERTIRLIAERLNVEYKEYEGVIMSKI